MILSNWADWILLIWFGWFILYNLFRSVVAEKADFRAAYFIAAIIYIFLIAVVSASGAWS